MRHEVGAASVAFVGDDITDEDVFALARAGDLGVRVGEGDHGERRASAIPAPC